MSHLAPELTTEQLRLRGYALADFDWFDALHSDPVVMRHAGGVRPDRADNWRRFLMNFGVWELFGYGFWMVEERAGGARIGLCGLFNAQRGIAAIDAYPEAGWMIAAAAFGKGYATETMRAVLDWADAHLDVTQTGCIIDPAHAVSIRVADKLGYRPTGMAPFDGGRIATFVRPRAG